jgi:zinc protease
MKSSLAIACLAFGLSLFALAQDPEIPFEEFHLDNGLRVIVHEDRKAPIVAVTIWYHVGSKNEAPGKTGFAHLFEHLMFNGSENYTTSIFGPFRKSAPRA